MGSWFASNRVVGLGSIWLLAVIAGMVFTADYEVRPGVAALTPLLNPDRNNNSRSKTFSLVMFVHPCCPCSRASLAELRRLIERCPSLTATIYYYQPSKRSTDWKADSTWLFQTLPSRTHLLPDFNGVKAARFSASTSGQTFLYNTRGQLLFSGGITGARGHEGDNIGSETIAAISSSAIDSSAIDAKAIDATALHPTALNAAATGASVTDSTATPRCLLRVANSPVYGCSLVDSSAPHVK